MKYSEALSKSYTHSSDMPSSMDWICTEIDTPSFNLPYLEYDNITCPCCHKLATDGEIDLIVLHRSCLKELVHNILKEEKVI